MNPASTENRPDLVTMLSQMVVHGASDLHLCAGLPPMIRLDGSVVPLYEFVLDGNQTRDLVVGVLTNHQRSKLEETLELDFAIEIRSVGRFRGNAHFTRGAIGASFRHIPEEIPELDAIGHRPTVFTLLEKIGGLILVTGTTGSGKSTTLASMVQHLARQRAGVIVTVEDPVEFTIRSNRSVVKQREVGQDTLSFSSALRHVLRQDPDVIFVGEIRDLETMRTVITAAETGHLVLTSLHTRDAPKAISRIVDIFPGDEQPQVLAQLANSLEAVISQRLIPRADGSGRVLATEILVANFAVRACVREKRWEQLVGLIEIGVKDGMHSIDDSVGELLAKGLITEAEALSNSRDPQIMREYAERYARANKRGFFGR